MVPLLAEHDFGWHSHVLVFARYTYEEIAIIAINFNEGPVHAYLNLRNLSFLFSDYKQSDIIIKVTNWLQVKSQTDEKSEISDYYSVAEFIDEKHYSYINPYGCLLWGCKIMQGKDAIDHRELSISRSIQRLKNKIDKSAIIKTNEFCQVFCRIVYESESFQ